jgi:DNA-binding Lrp family transcriptional regulator
MENKINYTDDVTGKEPTKKQLEVLLLLNPFEGKVTQAEAAEKLGISREAVCIRMRNLKKRCPIVHEKFMKIKKSFNKKVNVIPVSRLCSDEEQNECFDYLKIKETF